MLIAMDVIDKAYEWDASLKFFAFDIPIPSSVRYALHHCSRSIFSSLAVIPRHRYCTYVCQQDLDCISAFICVLLLLGLLRRILALLGSLGWISTWCRRISETVLSLLTCLSGDIYSARIFYETNPCLLNIFKTKKTWRLTTVDIAKTMKQLLLPSPPLQKLHARHRTTAQCICNCDQQLRHTYEISVPYATFEIGIVWRLIYSEDADTDKYFHLQFNRCTLCRMDICIIEVVPRAPQPDPSTSYI